MDFFFQSSFLFFGKIGLLFFLLIYIIFAIVVARQVRLMTETLELGFEFPIRLVSYIHLAFSVFTFLVALLIL